MTIIKIIFINVTFVLYIYFNLAVCSTNNSYYKYAAFKLLKFCCPILSLGFAVFLLIFLALFLALFFTFVVSHFKQIKQIKKYGRTTSLESDRSAPSTSNGSSGRSIFRDVLNHISTIRFLYYFSLLTKLYLKLKKKHNSNQAAHARADHMGGLRPYLCIARGARVMLTANLWVSRGLVNGATGTIRVCFFFVVKYLNCM